MKEKHFQLSVSNRLKKPKKNFICITVNTWLLFHYLFEFFAFFPALIKSFGAAMVVLFKLFCSGRRAHKTRPRQTTHLRQVEFNAFFRRCCCFLFIRPCWKFLVGLLCKTFVSTPNVTICAVGQNVLYAVHSEYQFHFISNRRRDELVTHSHYVVSAPFTCHSRLCSLSSKKRKKTIIVIFLMVDDKENGISFVTVCIVFGIKLTIAREFYPSEWANDQRGTKLFLPSAATTIVFSFRRSAFCLSICIFLSFRFDRVYLYAGQCICCDDEPDTMRVSLLLGVWVYAYVSQRNESAFEYGRPFRQR